MTEEVNTNYLGVTPGIANYIDQEVGDVDLSEYYTKSESDGIFLKTDNFKSQLGNTLYGMNISNLNINLDSAGASRLSMNGDFEIVLK